MGKHVKETPATTDKDQVAIHLSLVFNRAAGEPNTTLYSFDNVQIDLENFGGRMEEIMARNLLVVYGISSSSGNKIQKEVREKMSGGDYRVL